MDLDETLLPPGWRADVQRTLHDWNRVQVVIYTEKDGVFRRGAEQLLQYSPVALRKYLTEDFEKLAGHARNTYHNALILGL